MRHSYKYENKQYNVLRLVLLAIALLADLVNIFMIPSAIFNPIMFLTIALVFLGFLAIRISTIYMTYTIEYSYYKGELKVDKIFYRKAYTVISIKKEDILSIDKYNEQEVEAKRLYDKSCIYDRFLLETKSHEKYILNLDDTMYAALLCEDKYDLFR